ncbi:MAG: O-antigen ligase family protein [Acidobacteriota bacterium]|nr:O-antigen ligase family protein [Acidobacteriota bacterium]
MFETLIWLVPLAVAVLGAWRPRAGLVVLVATLPFFGAPPGGPYMSALDLAAIAAILTAWRGHWPERSALNWAAAAFILVSLMTLIPSPYAPPSWRPLTLLALLQSLPEVESWSALYTWRSAADLILGFGLFLATQRAFAGRSIRPLCWAMLAGLGAVMILGLASQAELIDLSPYRPAYASSGGRLQSVFFLTGWLSEYLVLATPVGVAVLATGRRRMKSLVPAVGVLSVVCIALTLQRGAWVALAGQMIFSAFLLIRHQRPTRRQTRRLAQTAAASIAMITIVLVASGSASGIVKRATDIQSGFTTRAPLWKAAIQMFVKRPLSGQGLGAFSPAYSHLHAKASEDRKRFHSSAHNLYLQVVAERGAVGLAGLGLLIAAGIASLAKPKPDQQMLALGLAASLFGALIYGLVQYMMYVRAIHWMLWFLLACSGLVAQRREGQIPKAVLALLAVGLLLVPIRLLPAAKPLPFAGNRSFGFHDQEHDSVGPFRWTGRRAALRLERGRGDLILSFANGHPQGSKRPVTVEVGIDGTIVTTLPIRDGWEEHKIAVPASARNWVLLTIEAQPTFRPFNDFASEDVRSLGIAMREPKWSN